DLQWTVFLSGERVLDLRKRIARHAEHRCFGRVPGRLEAFTGLGQIAIAVSVHVNNIAVEDEPHPKLCFRAEDEKRIARIGLIFRFLGDGARNLREISGVDREAAENKPEQYEPCMTHWRSYGIRRPIAIGILTNSATLW